MSTWPFPLAALLLAGCNNDFQLAKGARSLNVSPTLIDLGAVAVGEEALATITISASGGEVRVDTVDVLNVDGDWFEPPAEGAVTLARDETGEIVVRYVPGDEGFHWARVTLHADDGDEDGHEIKIRGEGVLPGARLYPSVLDLGPVRPGTSVSGELTVVNEGRVDLTIGAAELTNPLFTVDDALPVAIPVGGRETLTVSFRATDASEQTGLATLDLGAVVSLGDVTLRANACSTAAGDAYDVDGDGFSYCASDCDDWDAAANPAGTETCDGTDEDCDGTIDEGTPCVDDDGDGLSEDEGDCNDGDAAVSPAFAEIFANGIDDDCDGTADDGSVDDDGDGYGTDAGDCDDADASAYPGAEETADGDDDDCDGLADDGTDAYDDDGDGYAEDAGDCDDTDTSASPGARESADWLDNDCDGAVDEGTTYGDDDADGFTEVGGDCDDADASVNPGEPEVTGNRVDDNCDGTVE